MGMSDVSNPFRAGGEALTYVSAESASAESGVSNPFRAGGEALAGQADRDAGQAERFKPLQSGR